MSMLPAVAQRFRLTVPRLTAWVRRPAAAPAGLLLSLAGLLVAALLLLTPVYLVIRTAGAGVAVWEILLKPSTLATLGRTLWLAGSVTLAAVVIAVPLAWLTACTDLPAGASGPFLPPCHWSCPATFLPTCWPPSWGRAVCCRPPWSRCWASAACPTFTASPALSWR